VEGVGGGLQENKGGQNVIGCSSHIRARAMQLTDSSSLRSTSAAVAGRPARCYTFRRCWVRFADEDSMRASEIHELSNSIQGRQHTRLRERGCSL